LRVRRAAGRATSRGAVTGRLVVHEDERKIGQSSLAGGGHSMS
jgi:hypothetical protein